MMSLKQLKRVSIKITFVSLCLLFLVTNCWSQQHELVWYFSSEQKSEVSTIKNILENLNVLGTDAAFFKNTTYLNSLLDNTDEEFEIRKQLDRFTKNEVFAKDNDSLINQILVDKLLGFTHFLRIELNTSTGFVEKEFTFSLYQVVPGRSINKEEVELAGIDLKSPTIKDAKLQSDDTAQEIERKLRNAIKRLIPELNLAPTARISINNQVTSLYYSNLNDTIVLSGIQSEDEDTERAEFQYEWQQIALDGRLNVPVEKEFLDQKTTLKGTYVLPDTGIYKIGLVVTDGIASSVEDTLTIVNFSKPQIQLSKNRLKDQPKISAFQFLSRKHRIKQIETAIQITVQSEVPLSYELNYFEQRQAIPPSITLTQERTMNNNYTFSFDGRLKHSENYSYGFYGKSGDVITDTSYYQLKHSTMVVGNISMGFEPGLGASILCEPAPNGRLWAISPFSMMSKLYILHDRGAYIALDAGVLLFFRENAEISRITNRSILGKTGISVGTTAYRTVNYHLALQLLGSPADNNQGDEVWRGHVGFNLGLSVFRDMLQLDLINAYFNPTRKCFNWYVGARYNLFR